MIELVKNCERITNIAKHENCEQITKDDKRGLN